MDASIFQRPPGPFDPAIDPQEDTLAPLFVAVGAAEDEPATCICHEPGTMGSRTASGFRLGAAWASSSTAPGLPDTDFGTLSICIELGAFSGAQSQHPNLTQNCPDAEKINIVAHLIATRNVPKWVASA